MTGHWIVGRGRGPILYQLEVSYMYAWPHRKALQREESLDPQAFSFAQASCLTLSVLARY